MRSQREPLSPDELLQTLRKVGEERYHHKHPFHLLMHEGKLTRGQLQAWALNRYYYQSIIPMKDAAILARSSDENFRRSWRKRIVDHDGDGTKPGGIEKWIRLAEATGLDRERVTSCKEILPSIFYAGNAYMDLVKNKTFVEAVGSSLTELFSRDLISLRIGALEKHYPWLKGGLAYFNDRLTQAPEDVRFAMDWINRNVTTFEEQMLIVGALKAKCNILWAQLDAIYYAYVSPGLAPHDAFQIKPDQAN